MTEYWVNTKGKKFVGQTAAVPAPDEKKPVIVDYMDWNNLTLKAMQSGADPSEAANAGEQLVQMNVVMTLDGTTPYIDWAYDFLFTDELSAGGVNLAFRNIAAIPGGCSVDVVFPIGVTAGKFGDIKVISDDRKAALKITVGA